MQSHNPKEQTVKTFATTTYLKLGAVAVAASAIAASGGMFHWSDEALKDEVEPLESSLDRLRRLS
jgi:hypothetical protein